MHDNGGHCVLSCPAGRFRSRSEGPILAGSAPARKEIHELCEEAGSRPPCRGAIGVRCGRRRHRRRRGGRRGRRGAAEPGRRDRHARADHRRRWGRRAGPAQDRQRHGRPVRDEGRRRRHAPDLLHRHPHQHGRRREVQGDRLERVLPPRQQERRKDPLDPAALLPAGQRPRRARQDRRRGPTRRQHRGHRHPGRHLALLRQRQGRRQGPRGREARRLPHQERRERRGAQGVPDPHPAGRLRQSGTARRPGHRAHQREQRHCHPLR